jgi:hypothetical protein
VRTALEVDATMIATATDTDLHKRSGPFSSNSTTSSLHFRAPSSLGSSGELAGGNGGRLQWPLLLLELNKFALMSIKHNFIKKKN